MKADLSKLYKSLNEALHEMELLIRDAKHEPEYASFFNSQYDFLKMTKTRIEALALADNGLVIKTDKRHQNDKQ